MLRVRVRLSLSSWTSHPPRRKTDERPHFLRYEFIKLLSEHGHVSTLYLALAECVDTAFHTHLTDFR